MASTKEKMQQARQLIQQKRYDEARVILRTVDHDKAYEWLDKIDAIQGKQKSIPAPEELQGSPQQPSAIVGCFRFFLFGTVGVLAVCSVLGWLLTDTIAPRSQIVPSTTELLLDSLVQHADEVVIESVRVVDTRNNGGEKGLFVTYISTETSATALERELVDVFGATGEAIEEQQQDFDSVVVIIKDTNGEEFCCFIADIPDINDYRRNRIPRSEFFTRIQAADY